MKANTHIPAILRSICPWPWRLYAPKPLNVGELWLCGIEDRCVAAVKRRNVITIQKILIWVVHEMRWVTESGIIDKGRYRPEARRVRCLKRIEKLVILLGLSLIIQCSVVVDSAAIVQSGRAIAASAVIVLQILFFCQTQSLKCFPILDSSRFPNPFCEAIVTCFGAVGAPLARKTSARTLDLAGIALIAGGFTLGRGSLAIVRDW